MIDSRDNLLLAEMAISAKSKLSLESIIRNVRSQCQDKLLQVEIDSPDQFIPVLNGGADAVLLDNFSPSQVEETVSLNQGRVVIEASITTLP